MDGYNTIQGMILLTRYSYRIYTALGVTTRYLMLWFRFIVEMITYRALQPTDWLTSWLANWWMDGMWCEWLLSWWMEPSPIWWWRNERKRINSSEQHITDEKIGVKNTENLGGERRREVDEETRKNGREDGKNGNGNEYEIYAESIWKTKDPIRG